MYLNKATLIGRVGKKPEVRYVKEDTPVASFSLATTEPYKTKEGERRDITEWHNIIGWRQLAKFCENYVDKGMLVYVEGRLQTRSWTGQDNQTHYTTEIVADIIRLLESKQSRERAAVNVQNGNNQPQEPINVVNQVAADNGFTPTQEIAQEPTPQFNSANNNISQMPPDMGVDDSDDLPF